MEKPVTLFSMTGLVNKDLSPAYRALRENVVRIYSVYYLHFNENCNLKQNMIGIDFQAVPVLARFKKKEDTHLMARSILRHRIQTLTVKMLKTIEV